MKFQLVSDLLVDHFIISLCFFKNKIMQYEHCKLKNLGESVARTSNQRPSIRYSTSIDGLWSNSITALFPTPTHDSPCCLLYHQMVQISIAVLLLHCTVYVQVRVSVHSDIVKLGDLYFVGLFNPNPRKELQAAEKRCEILINQT